MTECSRWNFEWLGIINRERYDAYRAIGLGPRHFLMPEDTDAFCRLVEESVRARDQVVDLGCGDGIPTVHALACGAQQILGVDISQSAIESALENWNVWRQVFHQEDARLKLLQADMLAFLDGGDYAPYRKGVDLIVSNPPYIPVGTEMSAGTVDGGKDGLRFIAPLLRTASSICDRVSWLQGSFSSPGSAIDIAAQNGWKCEMILAYAVKFRQYAQKQVPYLQLLKESGAAFFYTEHDGETNWFVKLGLICSRSEESRELASGFMDVLRQSLVEFLDAFSRSGPSLGGIRQFSFPVRCRYGIYPE
jgi:predicted RNA methylase